MRTKSAIATFVALGATTAGVSALDSVPSMRGSDTLNGITDRVIGICETNAVAPRITPTGSIVYDGTGSGNGQNNLAGSAILTVTSGAITENPTQTVAPMSRTMNNGVCASMTAPNSTLGGAFDVRGEAEGLAFALDGLSIVAADVSVAAAGCNVAPGVDQCAQNPTGIRYSGAVTGTTETIDDWREVLRIVYAGLPIGTANAARDCNSAARQALVNNWNDIFQADCPSCDDPVSPNQIRHAFRRDEESGTTDVFLTLLGLPTINFGSTATGGAGYEAQIANSHFCNVKRLTDTYAIPVTAQPHSVPDSWDDPGAAGAPVTAPYYPEFQDMDPLRRACVGTNNNCTNTTAPGCTVVGQPAAVATEQVCGPKGDLGIVLPINPPPVTTVSPTPYPTKPCVTGRFRFAEAPKNRLGGVIGIVCPNGDLPLGTNCQYPTAADGDFACLNGQTSLPGSRICNGTATAPAGCRPAGLPQIVALTQFTSGDGRVYNLHLKHGIDGQTGAINGPYQIIRRPLPGPNPGTIAAQIVGAYYRIHSTRTLHTPFTDGCQQVDATRQLGCLPTKSHCSMSYAGREATEVIAGATGLRLDQIFPAKTCIQNLTTGAGNIYPLSRKLYINSLRGFENLNLFGLTAALVGPAPTLDNTAPDNEQQLVGCLNQVSTNLAVVENELGFVTIPGGAICEDFNELALCTGTTANVNGCADNGGIIPNNAAYCGDTIVQGPAEQCDDGNATNGGVGDNCLNNCLNDPNPN